MTAPAPEKDPVAIGLGALGAGGGLGGACLTSTLLLVRLLQRVQIGRAGQNVREIDPIWGIVVGMVVAIFFGWRRSRALDNGWQRAVICTLSVFGTFFLAILAAPVWHFLRFAGMLLLVGGSLALGIAASRWAIRGSATP